jgi:hypothetical protein
MHVLSDKRISVDMPFVEGTQVSGCTEDAMADSFVFHQSAVSGQIPGPQVLSHSSRVDTGVINRESVCIDGEQVLVTGGEKYLHRTSER